MSDFQALLAKPLSLADETVNVRPWATNGGELVGNDLEVWAKASGLNWRAVKAPVQYQTKNGIVTSSKSAIVYRDDNDNEIGNNGTGFELYNTDELLAFLLSLREFGYEPTRAGLFHGGSTIWGQVSTGNKARVGSDDGFEEMLLNATAFDGSRASWFIKTNIAVYCFNSFVAALRGKGARYTVSHRSKWDDKAARKALNLGDFARAEDTANKLAEAKVEPAQVVPFLLKVYHGLTLSKVADAEAAAKNGNAEAAKVVASVEKTLTRLSGVLTSAPGQHLKERTGTAWGAFNAVTYDVDHTKPARTQDSRLHSAWLGDGANLKADAWGAALELAGVQHERVLVPVAA